MGVAATLPELSEWTLMKVTDEKTAIYSDDMSKKLNKIHFHYSGLNVPIKSVNRLKVLGSNCTTLLVHYCFLHYLFVLA